jgi:cell cycle sensor histidine kinase DivJ
MDRPVLARRIGTPPVDGAERALWILHLSWLCIVVLAAMCAGITGPRDAFYWACAAACFSPVVLPLIWPETLASTGGRMLHTSVWLAATVWMMAFTGGLSGGAVLMLVIPVAMAGMTGRAGAAGEALTLAGLAVAGILAVTLRAGLPEPVPSFTHPLPMGILGFGALMALVVAGVWRQDGVLSAPLASSVVLEDPDLSGLDGVLHCDPAGRISRFEGSLQDMLGRNWLGEPLRHLALEPDRGVIDTAWSDVWRTGAARVTFRAAVAEGTVWLELGLMRHQDVIAAQLIDVTRWKAAEIALIAERDEAVNASSAKSRFLANMSHELRTPLNAIIGFSDVMRQKMFGPLAAKYAEYADLIHDSGLHLLDLIGDVLDMSKIEADKYTLSTEEFDLCDAVNDCVKLTRRAVEDAGLKFAQDLPGEVIDVLADRRAIKQMMLNLISNAIKFTAEGGLIAVSVEAGEHDVTLRVRDTGQGISPEDLARLGRPFEQVGDAGSRAKGTGLGLSLVRALAELHGGTMVIESAIGAGTSVTVRLPVRIHRAPAAPVPEDRGPARDLIEQVQIRGAELARDPLSLKPE